MGNSCAPLPRPCWPAAIPAAALAALTALVTRGATDSTDARLAALVQRRHRPALTRMMHGLSAAGRPPVVAAAAATIAAVWWRCGRPQQSLRLAALLVGEAALRMAIKLGLQRARPPSPLQVTARGYSFPSGHAMGSATLVGALLYFAWPDLPAALRPPAALAAVAAAAGVGGSRVYLGVHHPSDVAGGWLAALAWLIVALPAACRAGRIQHTAAAGALKRPAQGSTSPARSERCGMPGAAR